MQNRVTVTVGGLKYTLLATEGEEYVHRVAAYVDEKLRETTKAGGSSQMGCAVLTAVNIADERFKEREASENLRRQLKDLLEENSRLKGELSPDGPERGQETEDLRSKSAFYPRRREAGASSAPKASVITPPRDAPSRNVISKRKFTAR